MGNILICYKINHHHLENRTLFWLRKIWTDIEIDQQKQRKQNAQYQLNCDYGDASNGPNGQKVFSDATARLKRVWHKTFARWCRKT